MRSALALAFGVTICVAAVPAGAASDAPTIRFFAGTERFAIMRAVDGAARRLASPECQRVLTDFTDPEGRTLAENLARLGKTPIEFFNSLYLWEDRETPRCLHRGTLAFTAPGQVVIRICSRRFKEVALEQPRFGDAVLIHGCCTRWGWARTRRAAATSRSRCWHRCR